MNSECAREYRDCAARVHLVNDRRIRVGEKRIALTVRRGGIRLTDQGLCGGSATQSCSPDADAGECLYGPVSIDPTHSCVVVLRDEQITVRVERNTVRSEEV